MNIGFDDVDFRGGGCTTHFAGLLLHTLARRGGYTLADYPILARLNPGIPWKTRGNAAVVLRLWARGEDEALDAVETALQLMWDYTGGRPSEAGKGPGMAVLVGDPYRPRLESLYKRALAGVLDRESAAGAVEKEGGRVYGGRGIIGAAASLAALGPAEDYTWELVAYRRPEAWGAARCVDWEAAVKVESTLPPCTFNNIDMAEGRVAAAPAGPDPVLAGFRGDCPHLLPRYSEALCEEPHFWVLYRSNQHTDAPRGLERRIYPYSYVTVEAEVLGTPQTLPGGHVVVRASTGEGEADLVFYREASPLNRVARLLAPGDSVEAMGSVRPYRPRGLWTVAVDKLVVRRLAPVYERHSPLCPRCGARMESAGRGRGYRCPRCGYASREARPLETPVPRALQPGVYTPREGRLRHLTAPPGRRPAGRRPPRPVKLEWAFSPGPSPPEPPGGVGESFSLQP